MSVRFAKAVAVATVLAVFLSLSPAGANDAVTIQGSTTFNAMLIEPHRRAIERLAGRKLEVIPNKSIHGLVALLEGRTRMAMISSSLEGELENLRRRFAALPVDNLRVSEIARTRVVFVTHPGIPIRQLTREDLAKILLGEITGWRQLGGPDLPIAVVTVQPGGGVPTTVMGQLLGGKPIAAPRVLQVEAPSHVLQITRQQEGALGLTQLALARQSALPEIELERRVEQELNLVTLGEPDADLRAVIEALRSVAAEHLL